ncbi:hypothetical protein BCR37DRAFT_380110 [Protomyces lactucae-debilis]|uniref:Protein EFR3 n=1 Tax=Protomyces lactucae-debilis TaxID=2754530 RepID=A0A1Y2FEW8_PROLT|nr:uncharacterized protein BCR37DRAFT_380110 [Protomyces lactucae-debilis]ORY82157.1 hypothetical protein BCR37DRAFT_380110 [Protomyces lactucae-debilis]
MVYCIPQSKHVKLTLACYPKSKTAAAHPNSSELQYLAYYASSRPKKLIKVGLYIRQKVVKDVYWNRQTEIIVSLDICAALIEKCHNNLNLFARDVIQVLNSAVTLASKDTAMLDHVASCFSSLAKYLNESLLATDEVFAQQYNELLSSLASMAIQYRSEQDWKATKVCVEALQAACKSKGVAAPNAQIQIATLIRSSLEILYTTTEDALYGLRASFQRRSVDLAKHERRLSSMSATASRPTVTSPQMVQAESGCESAEWKVQVSALQTLRILFDTNDATQIRAASIEILSFFQAHQMNDSGWASTIIQFATAWAPINLRFHILGICLRELVSMATESWPDAKQSSLLYWIQGLLTSKVSLIGLSTVDVLETLMTFARTLAQMTDSATALSVVHSIRLVREEGAGRASNEKADFLLRFVRTAGSVSSHSYYEGQLSDLCQSVLGSLSSPATENNTGQTLYDFLQLEVLSYLMKAALPFTVPGETHQRISINHWIGSLHLLEHKERALRVEFVDVLLQYLHSDYLQVPSSTDELQYTELLLKKFQVAMSRCAACSCEDANGLLAWFVLAKTFAVVLELKHFAGFVPMFYHIVTHGTIQEPLASALVTLILGAAADHHDLTSARSLLDLQAATSLFTTVFAARDQTRQSVTDLIQADAKPLVSQSTHAQITLPASQIIMQSLLQSARLDDCGHDTGEEWDTQANDSSLQLPLHAKESQSSAILSTKNTSKGSIEPSSFAEDKEEHAGRVNKLKLALSTTVSPKAHTPLRKASNDMSDLLDGIELETLTSDH